MTDWIAVLLGEQQEQEPEERLPELQAVETQAGCQAERDAEESGAQDSLTHTLTEDWPQLAAGMLAAERVLTERQAEVAALDERLERGPGESESAGPESGGVSERESGLEVQSARLLWRTLVRGEAALGWRAAQQLATEPEARDVGLKAGELDRLVERDARRYDGGFRLY